MFKRLAQIALSLSLLFGVARFCHYKTKGFKISKLHHNQSCLRSVSPPFPESLKEIAKQKFRFLGRGLESFSFLSEDGKVVLKLFNNRYQNRLFWLRYFPLRQKIEYNLKKWIKTSQSYQIAADELSHETGLIYYHPSQSLDCPNIQLIDPLGVKHLLPLGKYAFAFQKKAVLAYGYFAECARAKNYDKAFEGFTSLFQLMQNKMKKGIQDHDPLIRTNFGFFEDQAIQIDLGSLSFNEEVKAPKRQRQELVKTTLSLKHWLETNYPELLPSFYHAFHSL